jgi:hypothetical protein
MTEKNGSGDARPLNPDLRKSEETAHPTDRPTQPPVDSTSTGSGDNRGWTFAWAAVTIVCVLIAIWLVL